MNKKEFIERRKKLNPDYISSKTAIDTDKSLDYDIASLKQRRKIISSANKELFENIENNSKEEKRIITVLHNAPQILDELDRIFEERTSLKKTDWFFLMIATALQLCRIYMLPKFQEKFKDENRIEHDDEDMKEMIDEEKRKFDKDHSNWESKKSKNHRSWQQIIYEKVPYDSTHGSKALERNMRGGRGHRCKTLGHDPILGWIFGVCNILSDTITICPEYNLGEKKIRLPMIETYNVQMQGSFKWLDKTPTYKIFSESYDSVKEDKHRLYAAIFAQGLHLTSDKYSHCGLPIPFLSLIDQDLAYDIYRKGYDYLDFKFDSQIPLKAAISAIQSIFINKVIGGVHTFFYNPEKEPNQDIYSVRTRKIVLYSNLIATSSDVIQTAIRASSGDVNAIKNFDFGGFFVTIYRLIKDVSFIQKIKEEFIFNEWDKLFDNESTLIDINNLK